MARRVAALYDVEGNLPALDAVLGEVASEGVDVVVCGGDLVVGPSPPRCSTVSRTCATSGTCVGTRIAWS